MEDYLSEYLYDTKNDNHNRIKKAHGILVFLIFIFSISIILAIGLALGSVIQWGVGITISIALILQIVLCYRLLGIIGILSEKETNDTEYIDWLKKQKKKIDEMVSWYDSLEDEYKQ